MSDREKLHRNIPLQSLGRVLTTLAKEEKLDPAEPPRALLKGLIAVLAAGHQPLLIGKPGSGKTTLVECVASEIATNAERLPLPLRRRPVVECSVSSFQNECLYVHEFETRLKSIVQTCESAGAILFLPDLQMLTRAGAVAGYEERTVATLLTPYLANKSFPVIGATTPDGYLLLLQRNAAFAACFTPFTLPEMTAQETRALLLRLRGKLQRSVGLPIAREGIEEAVRLSERFHGWQAFPGKAIELLKAASSRKSVSLMSGGSGRRKVARDEVQALVRERTGLPDFLLSAEMPVERRVLLEQLRRSVFDQEPAIEAMVDSILTFKAELNDPGRPLGNFLFAGPTGVGKTELAKRLAELLFGSEEKVIRFDMAEYVGCDSAARLIGGRRQEGSTRGMVDHVLAQPFSVILLDEIEKAHPTIFPLLLGVLGEGRLTDQAGRTASLANSIVIMTSNLGANLYGKRTPDLRPSSEKDKAAILDREILRKIKSFFAPEFLNRLTKVILFRPLSPEAVAKVAAKELERAFARPGVRDRSLHVTVDRSLIDRLLAIGFHPEYGARPMQRVVQQLVVYPLAQALAAGKVKPHRRVTLRLRNGRTEISTGKPGEPRRMEPECGQKVA